jgi:hypothetical protein
MFQESKELPVTAPARVGKYHELAEAIRRGCKRTKRANGEYVSLAGTHACALGAAAVATGFRWGQGDCPSDHLARKFPCVFDTHVEGDYLHYGITSRNDQGMSREAIADWLDSL